MNSTRDTIVLLVSLTWLAACAATDRSKLTTNSGMPLSPAMQAYRIDRYVLRNEIDPARQSITGSVEIRYTAVAMLPVLELDFDGLMKVDSVTDADGSVDYRHDEAKLYISLPRALAAGEGAALTIAYHGKPRVAPKAPWDGGFVWSKTPAGKPWVATAVQGEGCDLWFPCKDHPSGEPAGIDLYFTVPEELTAASNGILAGVEDTGDGRRTFHWQSDVPVNTYGIALNVAPYVLIESAYESVNGTRVPVMFWAIEDHESDARALFDAEFLDVIAFFERKLGPYPWGHEKLGIAETPHLGMEHQTINAYGNEFKRDDYGFDWLFHHELAHEWFGNLMTHETVSDMWLHEGFGAFMQPEYTREVIGDAAFHARMYKSYLGIKACNAIAPREEFSEDELYFDDAEGKGPGGDIYSKGAWVLHSLRYLIGEEAFWDSVRRLLYDTVEPQTLKPPIEPRFRSTDDFLAIAGEEAGEDLGWFFEVYVRQGPLPVLEATEDGTGVKLAWSNAGETAFPMPVPVRVAGEMRRVEFDGNEARIQDVTMSDLQIDPYMQVLRKLPVVPTCAERRAEEAAAKDP